MNRSIRRLYTTMAAGIGLLVLMLGWWQVVAAEDLRDRPDNQQTAQAQRLVDRGRIISADGVVLAQSTPRQVKGQRVYRRQYPQGTLAANAVGYISDERGKTGLESTYDRYLSGSFGTEPLLQRLNLREKRGADLRLSLDMRVQRAAEEGLAATGGPGAAVAFDPTTGRVLAMASAPTFDLQTAITDFGAIPSDGGALLNRTTSGLYPPGSTFKVVTAAAALGRGDVTPETRFRDTGSFDTPGGPIRNAGLRTYGDHTLTTALTLSINTTFASLGDALGPEALGETMDEFGFGERPPIDLPDDEVLVSGRRDAGTVLPNGEGGADAARIAIGQERLTVTPLQMMMVAGTVANGGVLMAPRLMERITDRGGSVVQRGDPQEIGRVIEATTAADLTAMMERVVQEGTGTAAALSAAGVSVAGKTGTAESDDPDRNQAWFIGFAPSDDPVVAVAVVIEDTPSSGGTVAAPVAAAIMNAAVEAR